MAAAISGWDIPAPWHRDTQTRSLSLKVFIASSRSIIPAIHDDVGLFDLDLRDVARLAGHPFQIQTRGDLLDPARKGSLPRNSEQR